MITLNIDPKGLTEADVQRAIDRFISENESRALRYKWEAERRERLANKRVAQGHRLRMVNAIKRGGVSVRTQESWSGGQVEVSRRGNDSGWYELYLYPRSFGRYGTSTPEQQEQYDQALAYLIKRLQNNAEIEFVIETKLEDAPYYAEDKTPQEKTYYEARLVADIKPEEGN